MERGGDGINSNRVGAGWGEGEDMNLAAPDGRWWTRRSGEHRQHGSR
jgi:hypothetical protein